MKLAIVIGNRPHFIKCAPLLQELRKHPQIEYQLIHSGQHYDMELSGIFLKDFDFPPINVNLNTGSASCSVQTAKILMGLDPVYKSSKPDCVISMGDTNTTLAAALAAYQNHIPSAHIEAGMRENIWRPEEINKKMADHCSDFLFAPIPRAVENLRREGIDPDKIFLTGDITYDTFLANVDMARGRLDEMMETFKIPYHFDLMTLHRAETVDDPALLKEILNALKKWDRPIVYPVHPRTANRLKEFGLTDTWVQNSNIVPLPALPYMDFLTLLSNAHHVLTDSSGVLKEAFYAQKMCLVLDDTSEYREIFEMGAAVMGGRTEHSILTRKSHIEHCRFPTISENPFGKGDAARRMVEILNSRL